MALIFNFWLQGRFCASANSFEVIWGQMAAYEYPVIGRLVSWEAGEMYLTLSPGFDVSPGDLVAA